jgi:hypothetical protein
MSTAKVIEISSTSTESFEDAIRSGIKKAGATVEHIEGAWIKEQKVVIANNEIQEFRVDMKVTFLLK